MWLTNLNINWSHSNLFRGNYVDIDCKYTIYNKFLELSTCVCCASVLIMSLCILCYLEGMFSFEKIMSLLFNTWPQQDKCIFTSLCNDRGWV